MTIPNEQIMLDFASGASNASESARARRVPPGKAVVGKPMSATMAVTEVARVLGISRTTAYEAVRDGTIPSLRVRRRIAVSRAWVTSALNGHVRPAEYDEDVDFVVDWPDDSEVPLEPPSV